MHCFAKFQLMHKTLFDVAWGSRTVEETGEMRWVGKYVGIELGLEETVR